MKILKFLSDRFHNEDTDFTDFSVIEEHFNDSSELELTSALALLSEKRYISIFDCDNRPYYVNILPLGVKAVEEDTFFKKAYSVVKEVHNFFR